MGDVTYPQIRQNFYARHDRGEFRTAKEAKYSSGRLFTTPETIHAERDIVRLMQRGQGAAPQILPIQGAVRITDARELLNPAQRRVIEEVLTSRDQTHGLQGLAGSGKTTALETIRQGAEKAGYAVEGFAPTSRATQQLKEAGISADTLQAHLARERRKALRETRRLFMVVNRVLPAPGK